MRFTELFAGIGGFRVGFENISKAEGTQQGWSKKGKDISTTNKQRTRAEYFSCIWANEIDKSACQIYRKNFGKGELYEGDIRTVQAGNIPNHELLCAGFPCQSFSIAGKRGGFEDTRGTLFFEIARIAKAKRPKLLLLENVKGLLSHDNGKTFGTILATLSDLGYICEWQVLNSKDFGVPQNRERVFIVGHLRKIGGRTVFPIGEDSKADIVLPTLTARYGGGKQMEAICAKSRHKGEAKQKECTTPKE